MSEAINPQIREKYFQVLKDAKKCIFGQDALLSGILNALICEGHILVEGAPGLGKTKSILTMSRLCDLQFKRIQFTPDIMPSDILGTMVFNPQKMDFSVKFGPIFTQLLLADEINRAPPKVQAALLEAMEEKQVTIGDKGHALSSPFVVMATQNPLEHEGTYPLPEAQLDRFMTKIQVGYPDAASEEMLLDQYAQKSSASDKINSIISSDDIWTFQEEVNKIFVDVKIKKMIVRIVQGCRPQSSEFPHAFKDKIVYGPSPRASLWLFKLARLKAYTDGREFVTPDHLSAVAGSVLGHRIGLSYEAKLDHTNSQELALSMAQHFM